MTIPDGGMNWRTVYLADENVAHLAARFSTIPTFVVAGRDFSKPMILRTTDGGDNWETVSYVAGSTNQALDSQGFRAACNLSEGTTIILGETALIRATLTQTAMSAESVFSTSPNQFKSNACSGTDDALGRRQVTGTVPFELEGINVDQSTHRFGSQYGSIL
ncbi:MAG: hypothetical protein IPJ30_28025 [Acidobacteria bacterium]|nr:hypothetical protein [Acidobacteriota bacterium]